MAERLVVSKRLLDQYDFVRFWCSRTASGMANQMFAVAVGWRVYALTHSATMLGLIGLVQFMPMVMVSLFAGMVADRYNRRVVGAICQASSAMINLSLCAIMLSGRDHVQVIFVLVALMGGVRSFEVATMQAMLPSLVPVEILPRALAAMTSAMQTAFIVGPALGGLLYGLGAAAPFGVAAACSALSCMMSLSLVGPRRMFAAKSRLREIFHGIIYIWREKVVLGAISLDLFAMLLGGATALLPVYARDILHIGSAGLGILRAAPAVGALVASFFFTRFPIKSGIGIKMLAAVMVFGAATILFGLSRSLYFSLFALMLLGGADMISVLVRAGLVQLRTPDEMRGRVAAVNSLFIGTSNQLGEFESGMMAGWLGPVFSVVSGGIGTILVAILWMRMFPALRDAEGIDGRGPAES